MARGGREGTGAGGLAEADHHRPDTRPELDSSARRGPPARCSGEWHYLGTTIVLDSGLHSAEYKGRAVHGLELADVVDQLNALHGQTAQRETSGPAIAGQAVAVVAAPAETEPPAAEPERPSVEWDGEGLEPTGELVRCSGYLYQLTGVCVGTPEEFWCAKRLPLENDAYASHIDGGLSVPTRAKALAWAEAEGAERRAHRNAWERHPALVRPLPFSNTPVITELEPGYERVVQFGSEFRLFTSGKRVEAASAQSAPGNKYAFLLYGGKKRAAALSNIQLAAFTAVPSDALTLVGPHPRTEDHCVYCGPGTSNGRAKTEKAEVAVAGADPVRVCVPGHIQFTGLVPVELLTGRTPDERNAVIRQYVQAVGGLAEMPVPLQQAEPEATVEPDPESAALFALPDSVVTAAPARSHSSRRGTRAIGTAAGRAAEPEREPSAEAAASEPAAQPPAEAADQARELVLPKWMSCEDAAVICGYCNTGEVGSGVLSEHEDQAAADHYAELHLQWHQERGRAGSPTHSWTRGPRVCSGRRPRRRWSPRPSPRSSTAPTTATSWCARAAAARGARSATSASPASWVLACWRKSPSPGVAGPSCGPPLTAGPPCGCGSWSVQSRSARRASWSGCRSCTTATSTTGSRLARAAATTATRPSSCCSTCGRRSRTRRRRPHSASVSTV
ncbi:hypothetical protein ACFQ0M_48935 [Kitasatospora aburaviensis]